MRTRIPVSIALCVTALAWTAGAVIPDQVPDLPVLGPETPRGGLITSPAPTVAPSAKVVDGDPSDWIGEPTRFAGTAVFSAGEYVYQDYPNDDWGADDGRDAERLATEDPLRELEPRTYRLDALAQALGDEFEVEGSPYISGEVQYGDAEYPEGLGNHADIVEARVAADAERLVFLVRTHIMTSDPGTAVLALVDTEPGGGPYASPGGITTQAEWAFLAAGDNMLEVRHEGIAVALACQPPCPPTFEVAADATGFTNAIEIALPRSLLGPSVLAVGLATGVVDEAGTGLADVSTGEAQADLINVAFRRAEPVRVRMDHDQALALLAGSIDDFLTPIDVSRLSSGYTESFRPAPGGYFDRVYVSDSPVVAEVQDHDEVQGPFQHYGVYLPTSYDPAEPNRAMVWLHSRTSSTTHLAAAWVPGIVRQLGERRGAIVVAPSARGSSTWYVGPGHEDFLESWDDAFASFSIDADRVAVSGHSMGGFGSYLVGLLYPDRFAAAFPISGPATMGGWLGVGDPVEPQDGAKEVSDIEAVLMYDLIENARHVPFVIYQGTNDELVFTTGVARMAARFTELGYRNRLYLLLGQEHYSPLIVDEWADAGRYLDLFRRDPNPAHVTYRVRPALERRVERLGVAEGVALDYAFDGAYWVDGLAVREGDAESPSTLGTIDAISYALGVPAYLTVPEASAAAVGQTAPFLMTGIAWLGTGSEEPRNALSVTLTNLATATLDAGRMALSTAAPIAGIVTTDGPAVLRIVGTWAMPPTVTGASSSYVGGVLEIALDGAGMFDITITP